ncbi:hypothetical protein ACOBR2_18325 [Telmatobacter bradus]|uniref:hypothetical protein n=1 Tax=Telmatobacter bradus TaxID=474953 RepID=UPI003B436596
MQTNLTANQLSGRATGALFFVGFGTLWLGLALVARQQMNAASITAVLSGAVVLAAAALGLLRIAGRFSRVPEDPAVGRAFNRINALQWITIALVVAAFSLLHISLYALSAITVIVGLHMFPLARLFRYWPHHLSGALLTAWGVASIFVAPAGSLQSVTAFGTGLLLWLSATMTLALAWRLALRSDRAVAA